MCLQPEIKYKKPPLQYSIYQENGFLYHDLTSQSVRFRAVGLPDKSSTGAASLLVALRACQYHTRPQHRTLHILSTTQPYLSAAHLHTEHPHTIPPCRTMKLHPEQHPTLLEYRT